MKSFRLAATVVSAAVLVSAGAAGAGSVTPDIIFGSGNANGGFTIATTQGSLELGLRAKLRYDTTGQPQNSFPWDGVDTYTFAPSQFNAPANRSGWNFEWSVNTDFDGASGNQIDAYSYLIGLTGPGGLNLAYDPFSIISTGYYLGTNASGNGGAAFVPNTSAAGSANIGNNNVGQNSVNLGFLGILDPQKKGAYTVTLSAFDANGGVAAESTINVNVIPLPAAGWLLLGGLGALGAVARRKRRKAA